jgi:hypothetical protein
MECENVIPDFEFMNRRFWIVNDINPNVFYWETFTAEHMMGLPYLELPDMTNLQIKTQKDLNKFLLDNNIYYTKEEVEGIYNFFNNESSLKRSLAKIRI